MKVSHSASTSEPRKSVVPYWCALVLALLVACTPQPAAKHPSLFVRPLFPARRVVAYYGRPGVPSMGVLGNESLEAIAPRLERQAEAYAGFSRPVIPAFEEIAVSAQQAPGNDGLYHGAPDIDGARRCLIAARKISGLLLIDVQPGREHFLPLVRRFDELLRQPDVGLALDPEWEMGPNEVPGRTIGGTTASEINGVAAYLADIVRRYNLPQKLFVIHQFTPDMIADRNDVRSLPELATTFHVDGFGQRALKVMKYKAMARLDPRFHNGLKLFYDQDIDVLTPVEVMRLRPQPDLITYQ